VYAIVFQEACTRKKKIDDMAPGGFKARKRTAIGIAPVAPVTGVTTRGRKSLKTTEVPLDGQTDETPGNCDQHTPLLHVGKSLYVI
jgi:hypothetical protein